MRGNASLRRYVLREIERNGPLLSRDLKYEAPADAERHAWWGRGDLRLMFEMLAGRGQIAVAGRVGTHRLWDLPERVWPETETLSWREAERELEERRRRRLGAWLQGREWHAHPGELGRAGPRPRDGALAVRRPGQGPRPRGGALGLPLPARDVRAEGEARVRLLRLPLLVGDQVVGRVEPRFDRKTESSRCSAPGATPRASTRRSTASRSFSATR